MGKVLRFKRHVLMVSTGLVSGLVFAGPAGAAPDERLVRAPRPRVIGPYLVTGTQGRTAPQARLASALLAKGPTSTLVRLPAFTK